MDAAQIRSLLEAILAPIADTRKQAEAQLQQFHEQPGFLNVLLDILQSEQVETVRLSTAIYIKNRVNHAWAVLESSADKDFVTPEAEKAVFRERLLPIMASSEGLVRPQLIPILQRVLHYDFPERWPSFLDFTVQLLNTNDTRSVLTGLECLLAICRTYRYKSSDSESRSHLDKIIENTFARLLAICVELIDQESDEASEMLHLALKCYKHATWLELSDFLRSQAQSHGWCSVFLRTIAKVLPASAMDGEPYEREKHHWWKAKKWAYFNLNRLFIRHGNTSTVGKSSDPAQQQFAQDFTTNIAPEILKAYLAEIEKWVAKTSWLSRPCLSYTLVFLDESVRPKDMWTHLKPHLQNIITHFVFPVMCLSEEDIERFEDEPEEYLHRSLNYFEEATSPDVAATNFLSSLTKHRRKQTFEILKFINNVVNEYEQAAPEAKNHVAKEGALRMIATLAPILLGKKSPIATEVEYFLVRYVFPDFKSPQGYLRARACDTVEKFEALDFKEERNLLTVYHSILECMADPALPVRVTAALALQPLIRHDVIRINMQQNIPTIMQQLLKLANEADVDALANVMEDFVEVFATELTPFAVALSEQLRDTYLRIIRELLEKNDKLNGDDDYLEFSDDKSITALGVLQTIGTLILTLESTPDVLLHIESVLMPIIQITLENKLYDLYNEVFEIIDSCTFAAKAISPTMWKAFELMHTSFKAGAELYLEDMLPALDNFVQYGAPFLATKPEYVQALFSMVNDLFVDAKVTGVDRICACKLAESMMLCLRGSIDECVSGFVAMAMGVLADSRHSPRPRTYQVHLMEMVIGAINYNPLLALHVLEQGNWTNTFFTLWFTQMAWFTRVHDKKLCIGAIVALLSIGPQNVPASVSTGWPRLLQGVTELFRTLPQAEKNRAEALKDDLNFDAANYDYGDEEEWAETDTNWNLDEEGEEGDEEREGTGTYFDYLAEEAQKYSAAQDYDEDDEDLGEESSVLESPLDKVEPYQMFAVAISKLQAEQPDFYGGLVGQIPAEDQSEIQNIVNHAQQIAMEIAAAAASNAAPVQ
uniref:Importin B domain protein n=1 Tax=Berkeleyomyces basicola TaxID=124036 RepID=A0A3G2LVY6_9PEZI|nr:importin B domain protein [Berkeleyomyces basicola]AYN77769.1 importin B domain protein [Berkeleyomyces basicola]